MKEIIHIQAGELSNYVGTHYFNTLESYFSYGEDDGVYRDVAHDVSFREGQAPNGDLTYCPRLLIFDHQRKLFYFLILYAHFMSVFQLFS